MKSFIKKIVVNSRPIFQIFILIIVIYLPNWLNITEKAVKQPEWNASQKWFDYVFNFMWSKGDWAIGLFLFVTVLFSIRKLNKGYMFNKGTTYKNYPYAWYWFCAKILGYSECNLILVPIYMQFKLVLRDTFDKYYCGTFSKKDNDVVLVKKKNMSNESDEVNIIIADTYPLDITQVPITKRNYPTISILRDNGIDHNRYDSPELVKAVVNEVRDLPIDVTEVNVYATTNPLNTRNIINEAFKLGERGNLDVITVFQQKQTGNLRQFEKRGKIVYKR